MFELSFVKRYLTPSKKQLSVSLIALLSVAMITLVVWLMVVFLSVTVGIEKNWLQKLTALNAPIRITPTPEYFSSYYYNIDRYCEASNYQLKSLEEKAGAEISDPYNPDLDEELPRQLARPDIAEDGTLIDPVKGLLSSLSSLEKMFPGLSFQDVEMSGALLRLDLVRADPNFFQGNERHSQLTNVSYLASFPEKNPQLYQLILPPTSNDVNHLIELARREGNSDALESVFASSDIRKLRNRKEIWPINLDLLPEKTPLEVEIYSHGTEISHLVIPTVAGKNKEARIEKRQGQIFLMREGEVEMPLDDSIPSFSVGPASFDVAERVENFSFKVSGLVQNRLLRGTVDLKGLEVAEASINTKSPIDGDKLPLWPYFFEGEGKLPTKGNQSGILLAKNFRENGVQMGDGGYLSYTVPSLSGHKELRLPIYVAGFYDPGIMAVGNRCILVPKSITSSINASEHAFTLDPAESNQFFVWLPKIEEAQKAKQEILRLLGEQNLSRYWKVQTFHEYDFAKDLMQQFQSDKTLFTLVGFIILLVACTNIVSLLVILVSDKKREIGILRAMGAKGSSIGAIFALSGAVLGICSCLLGVFLASITLTNIDSLATFLSRLQGHEAFNAQFFGHSLPKEMSRRALLFALLATPLLALVSGLIPAIKAARLKTTDTLRSE